MVAFFNFYLPPVALSRPVSALPSGRIIERRSNRFAAAAVRVAAATGEFGLFLGILLAVTVSLVVIAGFFA
jgi:hypothetical protein